MSDCEATDTECSIQLVPKQPTSTICASCVKRVKAWRYCVRGWGLLLNDCSVRCLVGFCVFVSVVLAFCALDRSKVQHSWYSLSSSMLFALALEGINSIIERICDHVQPNTVKLLGTSKTWLLQ